jgi:hypothetical protein
LQAQCNGRDPDKGCGDESESERMQQVCHSVSKLPRRGAAHRRARRGELRLD